MSIQSFNFGSVAVSFNQAGFLNATQIAKHFGKLTKDYLKTQPTREYISALAESLSNRNKILVKPNQLVIIKNGSSRNGGGTWLHPKLAIHFARWLDPKFAVWCDEQIEQILSGSLKLEPQQTTLPFQGKDVWQIMGDCFAQDQARRAQNGMQTRAYSGDVLDKPVAPALPAPAPLDDDLLLSIGHLLLHAQEMRLFVNRYLPAFENLGLDNKGSLWSYVHDTEPCFAKVRAFFLQQKPYQNHYFFADRVDFLRREIMTTAKI